MPTSEPFGQELIGRTLGNFLVQKRLGSGATGVVFQALDTRTQSPCALKVLHENMGSISSLKGRFEREAKVLHKLDHPNVVHIHDFDDADGYTFIAMELLHGVTLEELLAKQAVQVHHALSIVGAVLTGLAEAHDQGIVHRDLKPANVFLHLSRDKSGREVETVKLLDFGLAKLLAPDDTTSENTLTRRGRIVGTPAYMAPEQITGVSLDVRADVYAMGVLIFELLADRRPFHAEKRSDLLRAHLTDAVPSMTAMRPGLEVHPKLDAFVRRALEKDPSARFANGREMLETLRALPKSAASYRESRRIDPGRSRTGATSELISSGERAAISEALTGRHAALRFDEETAVPQGPSLAMQQALGLRPSGNPIAAESIKRSDPPLATSGPRPARKRDPSTPISRPLGATSLGFTQEQPLRERLLSLVKWAAYGLMFLGLGVALGALLRFLRN